MTSRLQSDLERSLGLVPPPPPDPPPLPDITPGLHPSLPAEAYHKRTLGVVSKTALDMVNRSPLHYYAWAMGQLEERDTPALAFGRAFHMALLEPERFKETYAVEPDFGDCRRTQNRARRDAWREENDGKERIDEEDGRAIAGMVQAVRKHPLAGRMIREGVAELTMSWKDPETGLLCKSRCDYYVERRAMIVDAKSCHDASWEEFRRDVAKYGYHRQDALYRAGAVALGMPVQHFCFIAVEKEPPYAVAIYSLDAEGIGRGYTSVRRDIDTLAECLRTNTWPGYPPGITEIDLPSWAD